MEAFPTGLFRGPFFGKVISSGLVNAADPDLHKWNYNVELVEFDGQEWNDHAVSPELTGVRNVFESANTSKAALDSRSLTASAVVRAVSVRLAPKLIARKSASLLEERTRKAFLVMKSFVGSCRRTCRFSLRDAAAAKGQSALVRPFRLTSR